MITLQPESQGTAEPVSTATCQMHDAARRHRLQTRRATYAREHGMVREAHGRYHFSPSDATAIEAAVTHLTELLKTGKITRQQVEADQQADQHRLVGWEAAGGGSADIEEQARIDNIRYRVAVRGKALDAFAGFELALLDSSTARAGRVVSSTPERKPWTKEANSAGSYGYLLRRPRKK